MGPMERRVCQPGLGTEEAERRIWVYIIMPEVVSYTVSLDEGGRKYHTR